MVSQHCSGHFFVVGCGGTLLWFVRGFVVVDCSSVGGY